MSGFWNRDRCKAPKDETLWIELDGEQTVKGERPANSTDWLIYWPDGASTAEPERITGWRRGPKNRGWK